MGRSRLTTEDMERRAGVSYRTLRRYVRMGLLQQPSKTSNGSGVRLFWSRSHVTRVARIRRMVGEGYSLAEVKRRLST